MSARWIGSIALCGFLTLGGMAAAQDLGVGRGIDHVASLVRPENFDDQTDVMTRLGFSITPALLSPIGAKNRLIWFDNLSYLEILTITDSNDFTAPYLAFLEHFEGSPFYGTEVTNAAQALAFLNGSGYPAVGPIPAPPLTLEATGQTVGLSPLWNSILLTSRLAPANSNFFLDYDEAEVQQMFTDFPVLAPRPHPNTAEKIETLWLVVADLDAAIDFYEGLGLAWRGGAVRQPDRHPAGAGRPRAGRGLRGAARGRDSGSERRGRRSPHRSRPGQRQHRPQPPELQGQGTEPLPGSLLVHPRVPDRDGPGLRIQLPLKSPARPRGAASPGPASTRGTKSSI
jgi:hypothetical protein